MVEFLEDSLRKNPVGTWNSMPIPQEPDWNVKPVSKSFPVTSRMGLGDVSWRVSTRREQVEHFKNVTARTYKNLGIALVSLLIALYCLSSFMQSKDVVFAVFAVVFAALMSRHYTKAWGGYAGGWSDYEHDPVQMVPHNSYVLNNGWGLM